MSIGDETAGEFDTPLEELVPRFTHDIFPDSSRLLQIHFFSTKNFFGELRLRSTKSIDENSLV